MRTLVTFVLRLWVNSEEEVPSWEGQVECVTTGDRAHVRSVDELTRFIRLQPRGPSEGRNRSPGGSTEGGPEAGQSVDASRERQ